MSSELLRNSFCTSRCAVLVDSGSDAVLAGGDNGLMGQASEIRVERRESISLVVFEDERRPFFEPLTYLVRDFEGDPIISVAAVDHGADGYGRS